jgi:hypothetical protein
MRSESQQDASGLMLRPLQTNFNGSSSNVEDYITEMQATEDFHLSFSCSGIGMASAETAPIRPTGVSSPGQKRSGNNAFPHRIKNQFRDAMKI